MTEPIRKNRDIVPDVLELEKEFGYDWYDHEEDIPADNPHYRALLHFRRVSVNSKPFEKMTEEEKQAEKEQIIRGLFQEHRRLDDVAMDLEIDGANEIKHRLKKYRLTNKWRKEEQDRRKVVVYDTRDKTRNVCTTLKGAAAYCHTNINIARKFALSNGVFKGHFILYRWSDDTQNCFFGYTTREHW